MIERHLGASIDIHGGGQDLVFPHHENEIAQGTCAHDGELYCRYWVHNGFVTVGGRKMSKSLGNVLLVRDLLDQAPGEAIRFALLSAHYRQPLDWSTDALARARHGLDRLYGVLRDLGDAPDIACPPGLLDAFAAALEDDLNFPRAIAELFRMAKAARRATTKPDRATYKAALRDAGGLLGLLQQDPAAWFGQPTGEDGETAMIRRLVEARRAARSARGLRHRGSDPRRTRYPRRDGSGSGRWPGLAEGQIGQCRDVPRCLQSVSAMKTGSPTQ